MNIVNLCIYAYWLLKPFYIGKSGTLQISDLFILIAFALMMFIKKDKQNQDKVKSKIQSELKYLLLFIIFVAVINFIYFLIYETPDFIMSTLYYIFIFIGIYLFSGIISNKKTLKKIFFLSFIDIVMQLFIFVIGKGTYFGNSRYQGTFNDPNQFGFFIILMLMHIYTISDIINAKKIFVYISFLMGTFLIILSGSTGMILALGFFLAIQIFADINNIGNFIRKNSAKIVIALSFMIMIGTILIIEYNGNRFVKIKVTEWYNEKILNSNMLLRIKEKTNKKDDGDLIEDRHLEQIVNNPWYCIYGGGQGYSIRFTNNEYSGEIHSTLPSILFYYGIIPTIILLYWIIRNLKGLNLKQLSVYIALLIESFTLINQRQLMLWGLIILANMYKIDEISEKDNKEL